MKDCMRMQALIARETLTVQDARDNPRHSEPLKRTVPAGNSEYTGREWRPAPVHAARESW